MTHYRSPENSCSVRVPDRQRAGLARQQGGLFLPWFARFRPDPADCVADKGSLVCTVRRARQVQEEAAVVEAQVSQDASEFSSR